MQDVIRPKAPPASAVRPPGAQNPATPHMRKATQDCSEDSPLFERAERPNCAQRKLSVVVRKVQPTLQLPPVQPTIWHNDRNQISFVKDFTSNRRRGVPASLRPGSVVCPSTGAPCDGHRESKSPAAGKVHFPADEIGKLLAPSENENPAAKLRRLLHEARDKGSYLHSAGAYDAYTAALMTKLGSRRCTAAAGSSPRRGTCTPTSASITRTRWPS